MQVSCKKRFGSNRAFLIDAMKEESLLYRDIGPSIPYFHSVDRKTRATRPEDPTKAPYWSTLLPRFTTSVRCFGRASRYSSYKELLRLAANFCSHPVHSSRISSPRKTSGRSPSDVQSAKSNHPLYYSEHATLIERSREIVHRWCGHRADNNLKITDLHPLISRP